MSEIGDKIYTIEQIKEAFSKTFLHSGEHWFSPFKDDDGNLTTFDDSVGDVWEEFLEHLTK